MMIETSALEADFTMAFQPIVDLKVGGTVFGYEALVRGPHGESAHHVLGQYRGARRIAFEFACHEKAIEMAVSLDLVGFLSLNISPAALAQPRYGAQATFRAAQRNRWPADRLIFELTEHVPFDAIAAVQTFATCRSLGAKVALDDFGAGYAGLTTLLDLGPDIIKLDMKLVRGIDRDATRQALVTGAINACKAMNTTIIAEGVETAGEMTTLRRLGIHLMQGYLIGRPSLASVPPLTNLRMENWLT